MGSRGQAGPRGQGGWPGPEGRTGGGEHFTVEDEGQDIKKCYKVKEKQGLRFAIRVVTLELAKSPVST